MVDYLVPAVLLLAATVAMRKQEDAYGLLIEGGRDGLQLVAAIAPTLVVLLTAVAMLRASGATETLARWLSPVFRFTGIPPEVSLLVLIRPISGSAALAVGADIMAQYGVNSQIGRTAAVMLGSTETTFYTLSVYFGAAGIKKSRYALPAALLADATGFFLSSLTVRLFFSG